VNSGEQILRLHQQQSRRVPGPRGGGSIIQYQGRWRVRVRWQGKEQTWMADTPEAARALLDEKLALRDEITSGRLTLNGWLDEWLAQMAMARPRTHPFYRQKLAHVRPKVGSTVLTQLDSRAIRLALGELQDEGMSPTMLHHVFKSLSSSLNAAVAEQRLASNPCHAIAAPRKSQFEAATLTVEQAQRLIAVAWDTKMGPLLTVALSTGMRAGELLALTWDDVDLGSGQITVNKSVQWKARGRHVVGPTKTRSGRRAVKVEGPALAALIEQRRRTLDADYDLVFPSIRGTYLVPQGRFVRDFRELLATSECPRIRFHDLRHTAGLFFTRSVGVVVASRILGHADPSITARYYGHAQQEDFTAAASAMSALIGGAAGRGRGGGLWS
jgi:integrase